MTSPQRLSVFKASFAAYRSFVVTVEFSFCLFPDVSRYLGGSFYLKQKGVDIGFFVFATAGSCVHRNITRNTTSCNVFYNDNNDIGWVSILKFFSSFLFICR